MSIVEEIKNNERLINKLLRYADFSDLDMSDCPSDMADFPTYLWMLERSDQDLTNSIKNYRVYVLSVKLKMKLEKIQTTAQKKSKQIVETLKNKFIVDNRKKKIQSMGNIVSRRCGGFTGGNILYNCCKYL